MNKFKQRSSTSSPLKQHSWVTVVNPTNSRLLLQACDDCGVVKSENTIIQNCKADAGTALITHSLNQTIKIAV